MDLTEIVPAAPKPVVEGESISEVEGGAPAETAAAREIAGPTPGGGRPNHAWNTAKNKLQDSSPGQSLEEDSVASPQLEANPAEEGAGTSAAGLLGDGGGDAVVEPAEELDSPRVYFVQLKDERDKREPLLHKYDPRALPAASILMTPDDMSKKGKALQVSFCLGVKISEYPTPSKIAEGGPRQLEFGEGRVMKRLRQAPPCAPCTIA